MTAKKRLGNPERELARAKRQNQGPMISGAVALVCGVVLMVAWTAAPQVTAQGAGVGKNASPHTNTEAETPKKPGDVQSDKPLEAGDFRFILLGENVTPAALNNRRIVVGQVGNFKVGHAFVWSAEKGIQDIGTLPAPYNVSSAATSINEAGEVTGYCEDKTNDWQPFVWSPTSGMRAIPTLGGTQTFPSRISENGQVIGSAGLKNPRDGRHAFLYSSGKGTQDLGALGSRESQALGINQAGWVVGSSDVAGAHEPTRPFLWVQGRKMQNLGVLPGMSGGCANDINDLGVIVGCMTIPRQVSRGSFINFCRPFQWTEKDGLAALPMPDFASCEAMRINSAGQVLLKADNRGNALATKDTAYFLLDKGKLLRLPVFPGGHNTSYSDLSQNGELVGSTQLNKPGVSRYTTFGFLASPLGDSANSTDSGHGKAPQ